MASDSENPNSPPYSSPTLPPRKRRLSVSPSPPPARSPRGSHSDDEYGDGDGDEDWQHDSKRLRTGERDRTVQVCRDFTRNRCTRSELECKYAHPQPGVAIDGDKVTLCGDSLRNMCFRGRTCRYYHPPPQMLGSMQRNGHEGPTEVCRDFMRGRCARSEGECRFLHHSSVQSFPTGLQNRVVVCQDFLRGRCERTSCRYSHVTGNPMPYFNQVPFPGTEMLYMPQMAVPMMPPAASPMNDRSLPVCRDFLKRACTRESCRYAHPSSETNVIEDRVEICRDFQRGNCTRSPCRFYHQATNQDAFL